MKIRRLILIVFLFLSVYGANNLWSQEIKFSHTKDVIYGRKDGMALTMDVFQPDKPSGIGVILLVSGGWRSSYDDIETEWLKRIKHLVNNGQTVFAVVHSSMPKFKIPDIKKDIERAVRYVRFHASEWNVDSERLGIVGHSSGGHLSLLHAATAKSGDVDAKDPVDRISAKVEAVACFYPPTNFLVFGTSEINVFTNPKFKKFLPAFVTNIEDNTEFVKIADEVSPVKYITSSMPPTLIISGNADKLVPIQQSQLFIEKLKELNIPCRLEIREGKDHGWPGIADDYELVSEWFEQYLK